MAVPTVYKSSDTGAPTLTQATEDGVLDILDACLVNGYGSKSPAGWTRPFTGSGKRVFRNNVSAGYTGAYFRLANLTGTCSPAEIKAYSSMTDVDTGDNPTQVAYFLRSPNGTAVTAYDWVVVATGSTFWFGSKASAANRWAFFGAGDLLSYASGDAYRYFVFGKNHTLWTMPPSTLQYSYNGDPGSNGRWGETNNNSGFSLGADHTGTVKPKAAGILLPASFRSNSDYPHSDLFPHLSPPNGIANACMPIVAIHGADTTAVVRGKVPGVYLPLFRLGALTGMDEDVSVAGTGSHTILIKALTSTGQSGVLVETALDWGD